MTRFRFRFATVLKARDRDRDAARAELASALRTLSEAQRRRQETFAELESGAATLAATTAGGRVDATDWIAQRRHRSVLHAERDAAAAAVADAETRVAAARSALVNADRAVAALESLRDRDQASHRAAEFAAEQRVAEDLFTATSSRDGGAPAGVDAAFSS